MSRRIQAGNSPTGGSRIKAGDLVPTGLVTFSFKYLQPDHTDYHANDCEAQYFRATLARMKDLCGLTMESLQKNKPDAVIRFHQIDFERKSVSTNGFGIPQCEIFDGSAWQFAITRNEYGRVHGFVIENTFFVVWFDPGHLLYPGK